MGNRSILSVGLRELCRQKNLELLDGAPIVLRGAGMGDYDWHANPLEISGAGTLVSSAETHARHPILELLGRGQRVEDMTILVQGTAQASGPDVERRISAINLKGPDQKVLRTRLIRAEHCRHWPITVGCGSTRLASGTATAVLSRSTGTGSDTDPARKRAW